MWYLTTRTGNLWVQWHSFLTPTSISENVLLINTMLAEVKRNLSHASCTMKGWNGEMLLPSTLFHTSPSIHQAIHLSHSSLLLFHTSVSLSPVGSCLEVPSVSTIQGVTERMRPRGETSNVGCWPWFSPIPSLFELLAPPSVCAWFGAGCCRRETKALHQWQMTTSE